MLCVLLVDHGGHTWPGCLSSGPAGPFTGPPFEFTFTVARRFRVGLLDWLATTVGFAGCLRGAGVARDLPHCVAAPVF